MRCCGHVWICVDMCGRMGSTTIYTTALNVVLAPVANIIVIIDRSSSMGRGYRSNKASIGESPPLSTQMGRSRPRRDAEVERRGRRQIAGGTIRRGLVRVLKKIFIREYQNLQPMEGHETLWQRSTSSEAGENDCGRRHNLGTSTDAKFEGYVFR
jgi:hypothetical protein